MDEELLNGDRLEFCVWPFPIFPPAGATVLPTWSHHQGSSLSGWWSQDSETKSKNTQFTELYLWPLSIKGGEHVKI